MTIGRRFKLLITALSVCFGLVQHATTAAATEDTSALNALGTLSSASRLIVLKDGVENWEQWFATHFSPTQIDYVFWGLERAAYVHISPEQEASLQQDPAVAGIYNNQILSPPITTEVNDNAEPTAASSENISADFATAEATTAFTTQFGTRQTRDLGSLTAMNVDLNATNRGKGLLVAVIDSGVRYDQPGLQTIADNNSVKLTPQQARNLVSKKYSNYPTTYPNNKYVLAQTCDQRIPLDQTGDPSTVGHGTHVAGILTANPQVGDPSQTLGVLPQAQLIAFQCGVPGTEYIANYLTALDRAIFFKADVINLSFGEDATTTAAIMSQTENGAYSLLTRAFNNGNIVNIAAGNSSHAYSSSPIDTIIPAWVVNPSTLSSPTVHEYSLSVASSNAQYQAGTHVQWSNGTSEDIRGLSTDFTSSRSYVWWGLEQLRAQGYLGTPQEVVYAGTVQDAATYQGTLAGKTALITHLPAADQATAYANATKNLAAKGASAVISICANIATDCGDNWLFNKTVLPTLFVEKQPTEVLTIGSSVGRVTTETMMYPLTAEYFRIGTAGEVSAFSSWGIDAGANYLKPDITAPGGYIYSTSNGGFRYLSGTSMASPNAAGASALIKQHAEQLLGTSATGAQEYTLTKRLLQTYATPLSAADSDGAFYSPRVQGAGLINVERALAGKVVIEGGGNTSTRFVAKYDGNELKIPITLHNYGDVTATYSVNYELSTDRIENDTNYLTPKRVKQGTLEQVTVGAGESVSYEVTVNTADIANPDATAGFFVDGFASFTATDEQIPPLNFAFSAFKEGSTKLPIDATGLIEPSVYDLAAANKTPTWASLYNVNDKNSWNNFTALTSVVADPASTSTQPVLEDQVLGELDRSTPPPSFPQRKWDSTKIAFSPNNDGVLDHVAPTWVMFNWPSKYIATVNQDPGSTTNPIWSSVLTSDYWYLDNSPQYDATGALQPLHTFAPQLVWNGQDINSNQQVQDGQYYYHLTGLGLSGGAQTVSFPLKVDTTPPVLTGGTYDQTTNLLTFDSRQLQDLSGVQTITMQLGERLENIVPDNTGTYQVTLTSSEAETAKLIITDYAGNRSTIDVARYLPTALGQIVLPEFKTMVAGQEVTLPATFKVLNQNGQQVDPQAVPAGTYSVELTSLGAAATGSQMPFQTTVSGSVIDQLSKVVTITAPQLSASPSWNVVYYSGTDGKGGTICWDVNDTRLSRLTADPSQVKFIQTEFPQQEFQADTFVSSGDQSLLCANKAVPLGPYRVEFGDKLADVDPNQESFTVTQAATDASGNLTATNYSDNLVPHKKIGTVTIEIISAAGLPVPSDLELELKCEDSFTTRLIGSSPAAVEIPYTDPDSSCQLISSNYSQLIKQLYFTVTKPETTVTVPIADYGIVNYELPAATQFNEPLAANIGGIPVLLTATNNSGSLILPVGDYPAIGQTIVPGFTISPSSAGVPAEVKLILTAPATTVSPTTTSPTTTPSSSTPTPVPEPTAGTTNNQPPATITSPTTTPTSSTPTPVPEPTAGTTNNQPPAEPSQTKPTAAISAPTTSPITASTAVNSPTSSISSSSTPTMSPTNATSRTTVAQPATQQPSLTKASAEPTIDTPATTATSHATGSAENTWLRIAGILLAIGIATVIISQLELPLQP